MLAALAVMKHGGQSIPPFRSRAGVSNTPRRCFFPQNLEPGNCALADVVGARDGARVSSASRRLRASFCWCGVRVGLRPNLTPLVLASALQRAALQDAAQLQLRGDAENGKDDLREVGRGIEERLRPVIGCLPRRAACRGNTQKIGCVTGEPVNGRGYHKVAGASPHELTAGFQCTPRGVF